MNNRINMLMILGILTFGSFVSYDALKQTAPKAELAPVPRYVDVPRPVETILPSTINIDLKNEEVTVEGTATANVNIVKKDSIRTIKKYIERIVEKPVVVDNRPAPYRVAPLVLENKVIIRNNVEPLIWNNNEDDEKQTSRSTHASCFRSYSQFKEQQNRVV